MAAGHVSKYDINLDSYCTIKLSSTHKGNMRLGNIFSSDVLFVPGLLQTLTSEPQLELKGCKIVSEGEVRTISRGGQYLFHATLERNSYVCRPPSLPTNSRLVGKQEVALVIRLGHICARQMSKAFQ